MAYDFTKPGLFGPSVAQLRQQRMQQMMQAPNMVQGNSQKARLGKFLTGLAAAYMGNQPTDAESAQTASQQMFKDFLVPPKDPETGRQLTRDEMAPGLFQGFMNMGRPDDAARLLQLQQGMKSDATAGDEEAWLDDAGNQIGVKQKDKAGKYQYKAFPSSGVKTWSVLDTKTGRTVGKPMQFASNYEPAASDLYGKYKDDPERYQYVSTPRIGSFDDRLVGEGTVPQKPSVNERDLAAGLVDKDPLLSGEGITKFSLSRKDKMNFTTVLASEAKKLQADAKEKGQQLSYPNALRLAFPAVKKEYIKDNKGILFDQPELDFPDEVSGEVKVLSPDGTPYMIDASDLDEALKRGWKRAGQ